jgi:hypothetical protein
MDFLESPRVLRSVSGSAGVLAIRMEYCMVMDWHARQRELACCYLQEMNGTLSSYKFMNI